MKKKLVLIFLLGILSLNICAQESPAQDSTLTIKQIICGDVVYCTGTDSAIAAARENKYSIIYPSLAINGVVINDDKEIDIIRNSLFIGHRGFRLVNTKLGPYVIKKEMHYSSAEAKKRNFQNVSEDGLVAFSLKRNAIFDIHILEKWLQDMIETNPNFKEEKFHIYHW